MKILQDEKQKLPQSAAKPRPSRCPFSVRIRNVQDGSILQDTLHHKAVQNQPCKGKACENSIMTPKSLVMGPRTNPPKAEDLLVQAIDFINHYYKSFKVPKTEQHLARIEAIAKEIDGTGTYQLTVDEMVYGAKMAWRNAPRCIGRIQWSNLQVFDARKCSTSQEMFQFLCKHIQYATNGGNLRSAITIFPQRGDGKHDFRVWNSQLVRYAGYQMPDGSIIGDPANVEFTQVCIQLGWKPKYGRFDVMPLILQANGEDPELFEIPPELILEVQMEHPQYEWFKELQLKWYALPAVANMMLEVGGLEFPGCPFNGWYMGTEIGVRNFCDSNRYNMLEEVARRMGLETHKLSSMWKDQALVAVNIAVLHSFQKNNVTIMDHHTAAESFMRHMETEFKLRGGCPSDWIWLVPPMSGALTPVFHQEMVNYTLSPFYYYQPDPWVTHVWKDKSKSLKKRKVSFKALSRAALLCSSLMSRAMAQRVPCTVLYATETGRSQTFAKKFNIMLSSIFNSKVVCMEDYNISQLEKETFLVVVTSTFGNGESPRNGESFKNELFAIKSMRNMFRYCVFGLGSRTYPQFCAFAHAVDDKLSALGAKRVTLTGEGDEMSGQDEAFSSWTLTAFKDACKEFGISDQVIAQIVLPEQQKDTWDPQRYRLQPVKGSQDRITALSTTHSKKVLPLKLKRKENLQSPQSSGSTILIELESDDGVDSVRYLPGEHVGVFPGNSAHLVAGILKHLPQAPPTNQSLSLEYCSDQGGSKLWQRDTRIPACPLSQALTHFLDITTPPSQRLLLKLAQLAEQDGERQRLLALAQDAKEYSDWKKFYTPTFLEVLEQFPSLKPPATFLLSQLPPLKPRLYSISSSPDLHPGEVHLTVTVVNYHTQDGQGPMHHGVCSTWLNTLKEGDVVPCFLHSTNSFHLPPDPSVPALLVGTGSGIAPFRSFWQQRLHDMEKGVTCAPMTLVFGCQRSDKDHLFKEETLEMRRRGVFKSVHAAYSRQPGQAKVYVQDLLKERMGEEAIRLIHRDGGHLYVCGSVMMVEDVTRTLQDLLAQRLNLSSSQAKEYITQMKVQKRFHEDVFGALVRQ